MKVETHAAWFRHDTPDEEWLAIVGEAKWVVLKRDKKIGKRFMEMDALLDAGVKSFVMASGQLTDVENAAIFIMSLPKILEMIDANNFPFIAKVFRDGKVELAQTTPLIRKGIQKKKRTQHEEEKIRKTLRRISTLREVS